MLTLADGAREYADAVRVRLVATHAVAWALVVGAAVVAGIAYVGWPVVDWWKTRRTWGTLRRSRSGRWRWWGWT